MKIEEAETRLESAETDLGQELDEDDDHSPYVRNNKSPLEKAIEEAKEEAEQEKRARSQQRFDRYCQQTCFHNKHKWNLFVPKNHERPGDVDGLPDDNCSKLVFHAIFDRIDKLDEGIKDWTKVVRNAKQENDEQMEDKHHVSDHQKKVIGWRCQYVRIALVKAVETMPVPRGKGLISWTWRECTQYAVDVMLQAGIDYIKRAETVEEWHIHLRENENLFNHPNPYVANGDEHLPPFFDENHKAKQAFLCQADDLAHKGER